MNTVNLKQLLLIALFATTASFGLTGCETDGPAEEAGEKIDNAVEDAKDKMEDAADDMEDAVNNTKY